MSRTSSDALADDFVGFSRAFGVLRSDTTPCGQPMSVSTAHALCELASGAKLNQRDLATRLGLTSSSTSRLVDQLVAKGWAEREPDPDSSDTRVRLVRLTPVGNDTARRVLQARSERFSRLLDNVPQGKRSMVVESLNLLKEAASALD